MHLCTYFAKYLLRERMFQTKVVVANKILIYVEYVFSGSLIFGHI